MTTTAVTASGETRQLVTFTLDGEDYGIAITRVQEIIRHTPSRSMPGAPASIEGVIDLRGRIIPVVDLRARLGMAGAIPEEARVVITELEDRTVGIVVDDVREVVTIDLADTEPAPPGVLTADSGAVESIAKTGDRLLVILDPVRLLAD